MNVYDVFRWIKSIIESSETFDHIITCDNLVENFEKMYNNHEFSYLLREFINQKL